MKSTWQGSGTWKSLGGGGRAALVEVPPGLMKYLPPEEPPDGDGEGHG
jgi:hypothetical protein